jgi:regulatory protein
MLDALDRRPRTEHELRRLCAGRGIPEDVVEQVLARLRPTGLVDDAAYAAAWVESRADAKGLGTRRLTAELTRRGIPADVVLGAVEARSADDDLATARAMARGRLSGMRGLPAPTRARRLLGLLQRRGFPPDVCHQVVREMVLDQHPDLHPDLNPNWHPD